MTGFRPWSIHLALVFTILFIFTVPDVGAARGKKGRSSAARLELLEPFELAHARDPHNDRHKKRTRAVKVQNRDSIEAGGMKGKSIYFNLFEDEKLEGVVEHERMSSRRFHSMSGFLKGEIGGHFRIVTKGEITIADFQKDDGRRFRVRYVGDGVHEAQEIDPSFKSTCSTLHPDHEEANNSSVNSLAVSEGEESVGPMTMSSPSRPVLPALGIAPGTCDNDNSDSHLDILIVYTPAARRKEAPEGTTMEQYIAMEAVITSMVNATNDAYSNSLINTRMNLVGTFEVAYNEAAFTDIDLNNMMNPLDEHVDEIHDLRNQLGADVVSMIVHDLEGGTCGKAAWSIINYPDDGDPNYVTEESRAFNVIQTSCPAMTLAHETGHNQGSRHDIDLSGEGAFAYSQGYKVPGVFSTVMASSVSEDRYFSNPNVFFMDDPQYPMGTLDGANNATSINNTMDDVADFRTCNICLTAEMGAGVGSDCDGNTLNDFCEVYNGLTDDDNRNGYPDKCEADCNFDGILDSIEISDDASLDCNVNGVLDSCDLVDGRWIDHDSNGQLDICETPVIYVRADILGQDNGSGWDHALNDLQEAIEIASSSHVAATEIWVAAGTYTPDKGSFNRHHSFTPPVGVSLHGGFAGVESTLEERNHFANPTILSGDLEGDDGADWSNMDDNSYHVVDVSHVKIGVAFLDGFVIQGGRADQTGTGITNIGGGLFSLGGNAVIKNTVFRRNWSSAAGALYQNTGELTVSNCVFIDNRADYVGGAIRSHEASLTVEGSLIAANEASDGGALYTTADSAVVLTNCTIVDNAPNAIYGGQGQELGIRIWNSIVWNNGGGTLDEQLSGAEFEVHHSNVQNWDGSWDGLGNIGDDPLFVGGGDYNLTEFSPCLNRGVPYYHMQASPWDLAGRDRVAHCRIDMGAYEQDLFFNDCNLNDVADACELDCNLDNTADECEIAADPSLDCAGMGNKTLDACEIDCDQNGVADSCDIAMDETLDCSGMGNTILDQCEADCDSNGVADSCDIAANPGLDCAGSGNQVLDACEVDCDGNASADSCEISLDPALDCDANGNIDDCEIATSPHLDNDQNNTLDICEPESFTIMYVDADAPFGGDGTSWHDAFNDLQLAISAAKVNSVDEIWVAAGTYTPSVNDRNETFRPPSSVPIYGGFAGDEVLRSQRDYHHNETILSGDLAGNDLSNFGNMEDNSYTVVSISFGESPATLDGLIIEGGRANGAAPPMNAAAGMSLSSGEVVVANTTFRSSWADGYGAAILSNFSQGDFVNCKFTGNKYGGGGAVFNNNGEMSIAGSLFSNNDGHLNGGAIGGTDIRLVNCTVTDNTPIGIHTFGDSMTISNSIIWNNGDGTLANQLSGDGYSISTSCVQGWDGSLGGVANIGLDPLFVPGQYHLSHQSPGIDAGDNAVVPQSLHGDLQGNPRIHNATGMSSAVVDMGAFESVPCGGSAECDDHLECTQDICSSEGLCQNIALTGADCSPHPFDAGCDYRDVCSSEGICEYCVGEAYACEIDWDQNGLVEEIDYIGASNCNSYYAAWYLEMYYPSYVEILCPGYDRTRTDWNRDGVVTEEDLYGPLSELENSEGFYTAWTLKSYYPHFVPIFLPEYHCN